MMSSGLSAGAGVSTLRSGTFTIGTGCSTTFRGGTISTVAGVWADASSVVIVTVPACDGRCRQRADWCVSRKVVRVFDVLLERKSTFTGTSEMAMVGSDGRCRQMADWCVSRKVVRFFDVLLE